MIIFFVDYCFLMVNIVFGIWKECNVDFLIDLMIKEEYVYVWKFIKRRNFILLLCKFLFFRIVYFLIEKKIRLFFIMFI